MSKEREKINSIINSFNSGKSKEAYTEIKNIVKKNNKNLNYIYIFGLLSNKLGYEEEALKSFKFILSKEPKNINVIKNLYPILIKKMILDESKNLINLLIAESPNNYNGLRDKAYVTYLEGDFKKALIQINQALKIKNDEVFGINVKGLILFNLNNFEESIIVFEQAIKIDSKYADSYNNIGRCFIKLENLKQAFTFFKKAYRINPKSDLAILNIANVLTLNDKYKLALKFYEKAKKINYNNKLIDENIVKCHIKLKNIDWVSNFIKSASDIDKINQDIVLGYSYLLLTNKKFEEGFNIFDSRFKTKNFPNKNKYHDNLFQKIKKLKNLNKNKNYLVVKEQGVGDEILFSSMYNNIINKCKNLKIECDPRLVDIFKRTYGKNIFYKFGHFSSSPEKIAKFENVIYSGSLTRYFRKNINDFEKKPFLKTLDSKDTEIEIKLYKYSKTKIIGISWKSVVNIFGRLKSLKIDNFKTLFNDKRTFINLQYGDVNKEIEDFKNKGFNIYNFKEIDLYNDFESVMSLLKKIDVFVTVSNSTAHIAGALGVPTILICPKKTSTYYYWDYDDGKTPWYNSINIVKFNKSIDQTMEKVNRLINSI